MAQKMQPEIKVTVEIHSMRTSQGKHTTQNVLIRTYLGLSDSNFCELNYIRQRIVQPLLCFGEKFLSFRVRLWETS